MKKQDIFLASIGFVGALPMTLIGSVLSVRLKESGFDLVTIGLLSLFHLPFALKPLLAPLVEQLRSPLRWMERKAGWLTFALVLTGLSVAGIAFFPSHPALILLLSFAEGLLFVAGLQVEMALVPTVGQMRASSCIVSGYRLGLLTSGAGTLLLAEMVQWEAAYLVMASLFVLPLLFKVSLPQGSIPQKFSLASPVKDIFKKGWPLFAFLIFYRLGDNLVNPMLHPFFLEIGFDKVDIAQVSKGVGMAATLAGVAVAGFFREIRFSLLLFGLLHSFSFLLFSFLHINPWFFAGTVIFEHFTGGLVITAFIATLWKEVTPRFGATQYALFWSIISLKQNVIASFSGILASFLGWPLFFGSVAAVSTLCALFSLPLQLTSRSTPSNMET